VNEVLRQVLAEELERVADADERLRLLTITSVEVSADLRTATVYVGSLTMAIEEALGERRSQLQRRVGREVRLKRTPRLHFEEDPSLAAGERVDEVLRRLAAARREPLPEEPGDGGS
jgi:ribosome-binding factor A